MRIVFWLSIMIIVNIWSLLFPLLYIMLYENKTEMN